MTHDRHDGQEKTAAAAGQCNLSRFFCAGSPFRADIFKHHFGFTEMRVGLDPSSLSLTIYDVFPILNGHLRYESHHEGFL